MSAPVTTTRADRPVRFSRGRLALAVVVGVGILVSLLANVARTLTNTDTYFHLRFGHEFLDGWSLRHPGSVSTFATRPWVPTQWLSEIVMAKTQDWFGLAGVAWLSGLLEIALFVTLYVVCRDRAEPLVAAAVTALSLLAMQNGLSMRPQVISYLLVAVVTNAWLRTSRDRRLRWWLIALVWLWAMLHGMWPLALVIAAVALVGLALDRSPRRLLLGGLALTLASAVGAALTPVGPELYTAVAAVGSRSKYFAEWGRPDWVGWEFGALALLLVVTVVVLWRRRHNTWTELSLVALAGAFAVYSERTVPVSAAMLAPLLAGPLQDVIGSRPPVDRRRERRVLGGGVLAGLVVLAALVPFTSEDPPDEPPWMDPALSALPPGTKVLDDWGQGGYLMWRYPQLDLLMHGYGDTFTTPELQRNLDLISLAPGWEESLRATGIRLAVLPESSSLGTVLGQQGWRVLHDSDGYVLLRAPRSWTAGSAAVAPGFDRDGPSAG